jgi:hypothetical protein
MTYQEIKQAEIFLNEIDNLLDKVNKGNVLFDEAKTLDGQIKSNFSDYNPNGYSWSTISFYNGNNKYCEVIGNALKIMRSALQALLNREPNYGLIKSVSLDLQRCAKCRDKKRELIIELVPKYSEYIKFDKTVNDYIKNGYEFGIEDKTEPIFKALIGNLELYLESLTARKSSNVQSAKGTTIQIQQNNMQAVSVNLNVSIDNCLKELDDCESISEKEIEEIKTELLEIEELLKDKKGKKKSIREKISSILKLVADKGTDAMIALLPTLVTILTNLKA